MHIMLELSTEDGQFKVLLILCLVLLSAEKYILKKLYPMTPLVHVQAFQEN